MEANPRGLPLLRRPPLKSGMSSASSRAARRPPRKVETQRFGQIKTARANFRTSAAVDHPFHQIRHQIRELRSQDFDRLVFDPGHIGAAGRFHTTDSVRLNAFALIRKSGIGPDSSIGVTSKAPSATDGYPRNPRFRPTR